MNSALKIALIVAAVVLGVLIVPIGILAVIALWPLLIPIFIVIGIPVAIGLIVGYKGMKRS